MRRGLLVTVVPESPVASERRARLIGELIQHGSEAALAGLATCEVVCAPYAQIASLLGMPEVDVDPWFVLVDATVDSPAAQPLIFEPVSGDRDLDDALAVALRDPARLARLAAGRWQHPSFARRRIDLAVMQTGPSQDALLLRDAAAILQRAREAGDAIEASVESRLAATTRAALQRDPPAGSRWSVDLLPGAIGPCGTGHVSDAGRKFLFLYTGSGH